MGLIHAQYFTHDYRSRANGTRRRDPRRDASRIRTRSDAGGDSIRGSAASRVQSAPRRVARAARACETRARQREAARFSERNPTDSRGGNIMSRRLHAVRDPKSMERDWETNARWRGITREYSAED